MARKDRKARPLGRRIVDGAILVAALGALAFAATVVAGGEALDAAWAETAEEAHGGGTGGGTGGGGTDVAPSQAVNPDVVAWVQVEGTRVDYPVLQSPEGTDEHHYLTHDLWGRYSAEGSLYMPGACDADSGHALVYGHHVGWTGRMLSSVFQCHRQAKFDGLGTMRWTTPAKGTVELEPAFAMSVDKSYGKVQEFSFDDPEQLRAWARAFSEDASAKSPELGRLLEEADRAVTLATCSSTQSGQRARTLVVFLGSE